MNKKNWRLSILSTWLIISLPSLGFPVATVAQESNQVKAQSNIIQETDYIVGAGDKVRVDIFQVAEYSGEYIVLVDGSITLPLVGSVPVEGLSLTEMNEKLSQAYSNYLKRPIVTVSLLSPRSLKIAIAGEIANPGSYGFNFEQEQQFPTVTSLIEKAGGLTTLADVEKVEIQRQIGGKKEVLTVNLWELIQEGNLSQDVSLRDGDQVIIHTKTAINPQENRQLTNVNFGIQAQEAVPVTIIGEVYRPGAYEIEPQVGGEGGKANPPSITTAIAKAGGIKPLADVRHVEIHRLTSTGEAQIINVNLWELLTQGNLEQNLILEEGDKIVIPTAEQLNPEEAATLAEASFAPDTIEVKVVGEVLNPGSIQLPPNTPLNQAILAAGGFNGGRAKKKGVELIRLNPDGTVSKSSIDVDFIENLDDQLNPPLRQNDVIVVHTSGGAKLGDTMQAIFGPLRGLPILSLF